MAQTKRKRRSKHRGNMAGTVVNRGRTGRKPTEEEQKQAAKKQARERRVSRHDQPPTWKGAFQRSAIATVIFLLLSVLLLKQPPAAAAGLGVFVLVFYAGMGYLIDLGFHKRRVRQKARRA